jgi:lysozyme
MNMEYSQSGLKITEQFEACKLVGYADIKGVPTVGYGHTGPGIYVGMQITPLQAEQFLLNDVQWVVHCVNKLVTVVLTQGEFDALCDLVFNIGSGNFAGSTLLKLLNKGDFAHAALEFDKWDKSGGRVIAGLLRRRQAETDEFNSGTQPPPQ